MYNINEKYFMNLIKKSVKKALNETSRRQKAQQVIRGVSNRIKTCVILTSENPMVSLPKEYNDRLRKKLESYLSLGNFVWFPVKGYYNGKENSYIIYNISFEDAYHIAEKFEQESFIYIDNRSGEPSYQYWEQNGNGVYKKTHERDSYVDMDDEEDFFTQISRNFKFQIPFFDGKDEKTLSEHYNRIETNIQSKIKSGIIDENYVKTAIEKNLNSNNYSGRRLWEIRGGIYGGYKK